MITLLQWLLKRVGLGTLLQVSLLGFALWFVASGLVGAVKSLDLALLTWTIITALLASWLAARTKVKARWAAVRLIGLGLAFVLVFQGQIVGPFAVLTLRLAQFLYLTTRWLVMKNMPPVNPTLLSLAVDDLRNQAFSVIGHFSTWLAALAAGHTASDSLVNAILWGYLVWIVSAWAAWYIRRQGQPLRALLPATALLAAVLNFVRPSPILLIPVIAITFILMIIIEHQNRERRWEQEKIDYTTEIRVEIAFFAIPVMLAVLGVASLVPSISLGRVVELARRLFEKQNTQVARVGQSLGLNAEAGSGYFAGGRTTSTLPQLHLLGSGPELSKRLVMDIQVNNSSNLGNPGENYYWRSLTYDSYTGSGWISSDTKVLSYNAGDQPVSSSIPDHRVVEQKVHFLQTPGGALYHTGKLVTVDEAYQIAWRLPLETGPDMFGASTTKADYTVKSLLPVVSQDELRLAGTDYPDWVKARYLTLPSGIPARVINLASTLTSSQQSPYDKAFAVQSYLRTYTYTLDIPAPPAGKDVADYFLFDLKKGYCDYYATAMVVLVRAAGIPARFVTGFASGRYDTSQHQYIVSEAEAHSWVEVYFPKYGWVEFEPTAGRPAVLLPEHSALSGQTPAGIHLPVIGWVLQLKPDIAWIVGILALVLILAGITWQACRAWRLRGLSPAQAVVEIYQRFSNSSRLIKARRSAGETPYELSRSVAARIKDLEKGRILSALFKPAAKDADQIVQLYAIAEYSQHPLESGEKVQVIKAWNRLGWRLRLASFWGKIWRPSG
jgi:transglutaminase-like putative cysteine protease